MIDDRPLRLPASVPLGLASSFRYEAERPPRFCKCSRFEGNARRALHGLTLAAALLVLDADSFAGPPGIPAARHVDPSDPADRPPKRFPPRIRWRHLSVGMTRLPSDRLTALVLGRGADLWAGTADSGLLQVREASVKQFAPEEQGLPASPVSALAPDPEGGVWVGTAGHGLARWSRESWTTADVLTGLPSNRITGLAFRDRQLMVATDNGLVEWSTEGRPGRVWQKKDGLPSDFVTAVAAQKEGRLWLGTREGLARMDGREEIERAPDAGPPWVTSLVTVEKLAFFERPAIVSGSPAGLVVRDAEEPESILSRLSIEEELPDGRVTALAAAPGRVRHFWVGTDGGGLAHVEARKDARDRPYLEVHPIRAGPESIPEGRVTALACDSDQVWVAMAGSGLSQGRLLEEAPVVAASGAPGAGQTAGGQAAGAGSGAAGAPTTAPAAAPRLATAAAARLTFWIGKMGPGWTVTDFAANFKSIWVGFQDRGVAENQAPSAEWAFYPRVTDGHGGTRLCDPPAPSSVGRETAYTWVMTGAQIAGSAIDNKGVLWFASMDGGLGHRDGACFRGVGRAQGVPAGRARRLYADRGTGDLYAIAANDLGIAYDDPDSPGDKIRPRDLLLRRSGADWQVVSLAPRELVKELSLKCVYRLPRDDKLYLGSTKGLLEWDGRHVKPVRIRAATLDLSTGKPVPMDEQSRSQIALAPVWDLAEGPPGVLWIAGDAGLFRDDGKFATRVRGTESRSVWHVIHDDDTRLVYFLMLRAPEWNRGVVDFRKGELFRYDPERMNLRYMQNKVNTFLPARNALWISRPPAVLVVEPKPLR